MMTFIYPAFFLSFCLDRSGGPSKGQGCDEKAKFQYVALKTF